MRPWFDSQVGKIPWRRNRLPTPVLLVFPGGSDGKESTCNAGDLGPIPGLGRSPGGGHGNPLQCSCLENLLDRGARKAFYRKYDHFFSATVICGLIRLFDFLFLSF